MSTDTKKGKERVVLAGVLLPKYRLDEEETLAEFETLATSAGAVPSAKIFQHRQSFDPAFAIGKGKVEEIAALCRDKKLDTVLFLNDLSAVQQRNLEKETKRKIVDRTALILDVFAQRARTKEGKLQVELAQLRYLLPRLSEIWEKFSRLGGGIGTRGPGETRLEADRRRIQSRIKKLESEIEKVRQHRNVLFQGRKKRNIPIVSLVGYTNAGKSSLLNALTGAKAYVAEQFFATLDPLVRQVRLDGGEILLTDTVGFLQDFPPQLAAAFRATLEELDEADLLLHVVDGSHPQSLKYLAAVQEILADLHLEEKPVLLTVNKVDKMDDEVKREIREALPSAVFVSAVTGEGVEELKRALKNTLQHAVREGENAHEARSD